MENNGKTIKAVSQEQGKSLSVVGDTYRILIAGQETQNNFAVIDMLIPPDGGPGPHAHTDFHETFYVMDGEVEVKTEKETYTAKKGSFVSIPMGGIVHRFKNKTQKTAHLLCTVIPAGLEKLFIEIGKPVETGKFLPFEPTPEVMEKIKAIAEKHGQQVFPPDYLDK